MLAEPYSVGVDWVTATTRSRNAADRALEKYLVWANHMRTLGNDEKVVKWEGYEGVQTASVMVGERHDGWITRASGWQAGVWYRIMREDDWHVTRMDVQVTGLFTEPVPDLARKAAQDAVEARNHSRGGRPYRINLTEGFGTGDTLTIGSRSSERYGRLYDKHLETKGEYPDGSWRWELETKGETACRVEEALRQVDDETPIIAGLIKEYFEERGVMFPVNVDTQPVILHAGKFETSDEKSLNWLSKHVRPTVDRLIQKGKRTQVEDALGLTAPFE